MGHMGPMGPGYDNRIAGEEFIKSTAGQNRDKAMKAGAEEQLLREARDANGEESTSRLRGVARAAGYVLIVAVLVAVLGFWVGLF